MAVVTGGSRGLGFEMARGLAEAGADLIIVGRDEATLSTAQLALAKSGRAVLSIAGDLGTAEGTDSVCSRILALGREIDILVNNVGGRRLDVSLEQTEIEDWRRFFDLNLNSALICCQQIGRPMLERGRGSIINVTSIAGPIAIKGIGGRHYEASKAALTALTKSLAADWAGRGVRVNAIAPGVFETKPNRDWFEKKPEFRQTFLDHVPMNRLGRPEEIAPAAVFLASDASSYLTGTVLVVDGGFTCW